MFDFKSRYLTTQCLSTHGLVTLGLVTQGLITPDLINQGHLMQPPANELDQGDRGLQQQHALNQFFKGIDRRAYRIAEIAVGNREDALELVQDAMLSLVKNYAHKPVQDWPPLFHRILQSKIRDWYRRSRVRNRMRSWLRVFHHDDQGTEDPIQNAIDPNTKCPEQAAINNDTGDAVIQALKQLPLRQQQAFLLRNWEGMNVADTAVAMGCSQGSVKTHYSRAIHSLRDALQEHHP